MTCAGIPQSASECLFELFSFLQVLLQRQTRLLEFLCELSRPPQMSELPAVCQSLADLVLSRVCHVDVASQLPFQGAVCQIFTRLLGARSCASDA